MMFKAFLVITLALLMRMDAYGQDQIFDGVINNGIALVNPSLSGLGNNKQQVGFSIKKSMHRSSSSASDLIYSAQWERAVKINNSDVLGIQLRAIGEHPASGFVHKNDILLITNYKKILVQNQYERHALSLGFITGWSLLRPGNSQFWFGSQYDIVNEFIDYTLPDNETFYDQLISRHSLDLSLGLSWSSTWSNGLQFLAGASLYHLVPQNQSILQGNNFPLDRRMSYLLQTKFPINGYTDFSLTAVAMVQGPDKYLLLRNLFLFDTDSRDDYAFGFGAGPLWQNGISGSELHSVNIFTVLQLPLWQIEIAYDIVTGSLGDFSRRRGNLQFGMNYFWNRSELSKIQKNIF